TSAVAAHRPAKHAAPNPRRHSTTTVAPRRRASVAEPSVEPLSTTIGRHPGGSAASTPGMAAASSRTGKITSPPIAVSTRSEPIADEPERGSAPYESREPDSCGCDAPGDHTRHAKDDHVVA